MRSRVLVAFHRPAELRGQVSMCAQSCISWMTRRRRRGCIGGGALTFMLCGNSTATASRGCEDAQVVGRGGGNSQRKGPGASWVGLLWYDGQWQATGYQDREAQEQTGSCGGGLPCEISCGSVVCRFAGMAPYVLRYADSCEFVVTVKSGGQCRRLTAQRTARNDAGLELRGNPGCTAYRDLAKSVSSWLRMTNRACTTPLFRVAY